MAVRADNPSVKGTTRSAALVTAGVLAGTLGMGAPPAEATVHHLPGTTCYAFPADNYWHANISKLPVNTHSAAWISHMSPTRKIHPDFGPSYGAQPVPYGIPITYVKSSHAKVSVSFEYSDESDHVGYPLGSDTKIEGGSNADGDRHAIVVDTGTCRLYELFNTRKTATGRWTAGSGATWSLKRRRYLKVCSPIYVCSMSRWPTPRRQRLPARTPAAISPGDARNPVNGKW